MKESLYNIDNSEYLNKNISWHVEDSEWKARQIFEILKRNSLRPKTVVEIGCGAGEILTQLQRMLEDSDIKFEGYDIAPDAYKLAKGRANESLKFYNEDLISKEITFDLCLIIDVFEHIDNYIDFIKKCAEKGIYKIYHIPLELHVSALLRNKLIDARESVGHIHYFTKETALATLTDTGQEIIDYYFTKSSIELSNASFRTRVANVFRKILFKLNPDLTAHLIGGYSLIVLTK